MINSAARTTGLQTTSSRSSPFFTLMWGAAAEAITTAQHALLRALRRYCAPEPSPRCAEPHGGDAGRPATCAATVVVHRSSVHGFHIGKRRVVEVRCGHATGLGGPIRDENATQEFMLAVCLVEVLDLLWRHSNVEDIRCVGRIERHASHECHHERARD